MPADQSEKTANSVVGQPPKGIVRYTVWLCVTTLAVFCALLWATSAIEPAEVPQESGMSADGLHWLLFIGVAFVSGTLGGCLYSLRGLIMHSAANDFDCKYNNWYLLTPLAGGISGIVVLFLILGGAMTLTLSAPQGQTLRAIKGLFLAPYIAFGLLAGFASRAFMLKMKDLADSLFALSAKGDSETSNRLLKP